MVVIKGRVKGNEALGDSGKVWGGENHMGIKARTGKCPGDLRRWSASRGRSKHRKKAAKPAGEIFNQ